MSRRQFVRVTGLATAAAVIGLRRTATAAPAIEVLETRVISHEPNLYHGWPTVTQRRNGQLLLGYSGGRESHVCPFGRVELMVSNDEGKNWSWPQVVLDSPTDDRDAGVLETARGSLLITTFTSLAYEPALLKAQKIEPGQPGAWPAERLSAWQAVHQRINDQQRRAELGQWLLRSTDGGLNWSPRLPSIVNSPHGPTQLADGRLLYAGVELWSSPRRVGVAESLDDGLSWRWLAPIPVRPGDESRNYHELHGVETADGRIVVQIRNHNKNNERETLQTESADGGQTWSMPRAIGVWGLPSFLQRLRDDRLLMTYGYRRKPFGNQARISEDHGRTWSEPVIISGDGIGGDLGYPSTVELRDGSFLTIWYEKMSASPRAVLRQARWRLKV
jgi:sialidase-1